MPSTRSFLPIPLVLVLLAPAAGAQPPAAKGGPPGGEVLPDGALARLGSVRFQFAGSPPAVAFSPDGKLLAVAPRDDGRALFLWEIATGKVRRTFAAVPNAHDLTFSADGKLLAVAADHGVLVFDAATGKRLAHSFESKKVFAMAFAPRGATLAIAGAIDRGGSRFAVVLWDAATGKEVRALVGHRSPVHAVAFSKDGGALVSCAVTVAEPDEKPRARGEVLRWDLASGKSARLLEMPEAARAYPEAVASAPLLGFRAVRLSPDGLRLAFATGAEKLIVVHDLGAGEEPVRLPAESASFAFTPDGRSLLTGGIAPVTRWDLGGRDREQRRFGAAGQGTFVQAVSPDGKLLATAGDYYYKDTAVHLWDVASGGELRLAAGHRDAVLSLAFSADGTALVSGGRDRAAMRWDLRGGTATRHEVGAPVPAVALSPRGEAVAATRLDHGVEFWAGPGDKGARRLRQPLWDAGDPSLLRVFSGAVGFAEGGDAVVAVLADGTVERHSTRPGGGLTGEALAGMRGLLIASAVSPGGDRVAGARDTPQGGPALGLWHAGSGTQSWEVSLPNTTSVWVVAFSPDGAVVASCETGFADDKDGGPRATVVLREAATGRLIVAVNAGGKPAAVALADDGRTLAWVHGHDWGAPRNAVVWDAAAGKELARPNGHYGPICSVAFAPGAGRLATGSADHTVLLWDAARWPRPGAKALLTPDELEGCWKSMLADDAAAAWRAMWKLAASPGQAPALLARHHKPGPKADGERIRQWIADLNSTRFAAREKATAELTRLGGDVEPALRAALAGDAPLEQRRRIDQILKKIERAVLTPDQLRLRRGLTVLEWVGTAEARAALEALTRGGDAVAHLAAAALKRLAHRAR